MKMTEDLAKRILIQAQKGQPLSQEQKDAIVMDWLAGMKHADLMAKHHVSKSAVCSALKAAKKAAAEFVLNRKKLAA